MTDRKGFQKLVATHRGELLAHCYRFTGSLHDAEDMVQETFLRAWRAVDRFEGRSSLRNWLYRIATNVCLNAAERKANSRRLFPEDVRGPTTRMPEGSPSVDTPWIEPLPDSILDNVSDTAPGPAARYEMRETIRLAFVAATQRLPARQRAVLLLRDVLGWSAIETAKALSMSVASVTSALQRARSTLNKGVSVDEVDESAADKDDHRSIADEYAKAWERADLDGFISLLAKDASLVMPPWNEWYSGRTAIRSFFGWAFDWIWNAGKCGQIRMVSTRANGQIALATYILRRGSRKSAKLHAHGLQVLTLRRGRIQRVTIFVGSRFFKKFGMAEKLSSA
jgi:RNA polymerase sigma-70 factor (ECF subfamily)